MSVRVVARVRPLLKQEVEKDVIVEAARAPTEKTENKSIVRIPNLKNESEAFSFQFNSVYDQQATQAHIFENEVSPTVKHLFKGYDVTLFAYGVTGTGKTHTMRGGKSLAERGVIPRLLSSIYRRARKVEKDSDGASQVQVSMSYYEIYNDRVFDLFEPPEKRTPAGLPIRDVGGGKTQVVGLTERPCSNLKEFEQLYDQANVNRSTSATKLNAHSSRSHAILCVKVTQSMGDGSTQVSTASAIDLAGSEDNRRTDNNKDRMVESASINKSLFVLAQCVEAISKKQHRVPYRESKMTRILALGQNNGLTVMILNLAPVRSYHLDTLSSLNFANRTKKIEVNEVENQPFFRELQPGKGKLDGDGKANGPGVTNMHRQPLRPKLLSQKSGLQEASSVPKPTKQFAVYSDKAKPATSKPTNVANTSQARASAAQTHARSPKRTSSEANPSLGRPSKVSRPNPPRPTASAQPGLSKDAIEALIEQKVTEALAGRVDNSTVSAADPISDEVQKRLDALEKRVEGQETERAEGLQYLLMAKQHQVRGEEVSALKMYQLALPHFPGNEKLVRKMSALQDRIAMKKVEKRNSPAAKRATIPPPLAEHPAPEPVPAPPKPTARRRLKVDEDDESFHEDAAEQHDDDDEEEDSFIYRPRTKIRQRPVTSKLVRSATASTAPALPPKPSAAPPAAPSEAAEEEEEEAEEQDEPQHPSHHARPLSAGTDTSTEDLTPDFLFSGETPRTKHILRVINTKDVSKIKLLRGVGPKKAEAIVNAICDLQEEEENAGRGECRRVESLGQLGKLRGVGVKTVEGMRAGLGGLVL
ncbi:kinesin-domain-containing protein [Hortaea werneckii]|nr:kinesin-domain-containing protein [Hortaea werneckii]